MAGEIRTINISKSSTNFVSVNEIETIGEKIFERLKLKNYLVGLDKDIFAQEISELYHSINMLHPFREGNGRVQRVFFVQLIRNAGYDIDYSEINSELLMIGTIQAASGVMDNLKKFFEENITTH